jgi:hypothetical protein
MGKLKKYINPQTTNQSTNIITTKKNQKVGVHRISAWLGFGSQIKHKKIGVYVPAVNFTLK